MSLCVLYQKHFSSIVFFSTSYQHDKTTIPVAIVNKNLDEMEHCEHYFPQKSAYEKQWIKLNDDIIKIKNTCHTGKILFATKKPLK